MLPGLIDGVVVAGRKLVVQTEDRGSGKDELVTSAFEGGTLVYRRVLSYADLAKLELADQETLLASALRDLHNHALRNLSLGKILADESQ
jgi:hypothetical protein